MSRMFLSNEEHFAYLFERVADKPTESFIATFGIYAGITYSGQDSTQWGEKFRLATRDLLEVMRPLKGVKLLIGAANYRSCRDKQDCLDCEKSYVQQLLRLVFHAELFPEFEWRITTELHLKCALFEYREGRTKSVAGVAGGRNFTDSKWSDVTFELAAEHVRTLRSHANEQWDKALPISDESVAIIFEQQAISDRGFRSVVGSFA